MGRRSVGYENEDLHLHFVMAGLVPAIHVFNPRRRKDVDARHKAGHDGRGKTALFSSTFIAYITPAVPQGPAMAINGRCNKPIGPGGSTRRLHRCSSLRLKSHRGGTGPFRKVGLEGCTGGAEKGSTRGEKKGVFPGWYPPGGPNQNL